MPAKPLQRWVPFRVTGDLPAQPRSDFDEISTWSPGADCATQILPHAGIQTNWVLAAHAGCVFACVNDFLGVDSHMLFSRWIQSKLLDLGS